jgi:hypothetical protein
LAAFCSDHEDRLPVAPEILDGAKDLPEDERREAERRFVEEHQPRAQEQRPTISSICC